MKTRKITTSRPAFSKREEGLIRKAAAKNISIPFRLLHWPEWVGVKRIYLNELKELVDKA